MKKKIRRRMVLALFFAVAVCGGIGTGILAQGNKGGAAGRKGETEAEGKWEKTKEEGIREGEPGAVKAGQSYAYVELKRGRGPVLLVADGTYGYNGLEASFNSEVYGADREGNWKRMGIIAGSGTAYPIRFDKNGFYVTGGHFAAYYTVDWEEMRIVQEEYAEEFFDENGNVAYVYAAAGKPKKPAEDNRYLIALFDRYEKAELAGFRKSEKEEGQQEQAGGG